MDVLYMLRSIIAITLGAGLAKYGNQNYEALKADGGILLPTVCLLGAMFFLIYGLRYFVRAFSRS